MARNLNSDNVSGPPCTVLCRKSKLQLWRKAKVSFAKKQNKIQGASITPNGMKKEAATSTYVKGKELFFLLFPLLFWTTDGLFEH